MPPPPCYPRKRIFLTGMERETVIWSHDVSLLHVSYARPDLRYDDEMKHLSLCEGRGSRLSRCRAHTQIARIGERMVLPWRRPQVLPISPSSRVGTRFSTLSLRRFANSLFRSIADLTHYRRGCETSSLSPHLLSFPRRGLFRRSRNDTTSIAISSRFNTSRTYRRAKARRCGHSRTWRRIL